ncbi:hypothetical protein VTN77DRAFT_5899 [Rasamsonia byssochlamydoides]|uniref:uncharacterized protein n=1 Tax=Rasamsonia byssochlamydoides TaxID=89139 RepID=UPI0037449A55
MHTPANPNEADLESLPPAVRRKFFSNLERFRYEQMRLAQSYHRDYVQRYRSNPSGSSSPAGPSSLLHSRPARARTIATESPFSSSYHSFQKQTTRRLRKRDHAELLPALEDWLYFHSLPPKIQQTHFSKEEQLLLQKFLLNGDIIDAADQAVYKFEQRRRALLQREKEKQSPSDDAERTSSRSRASSMVSTSTSSEQPVDSAIDMDDSFYDSFRWLDEDGDLDLALDDYHAHVAESAGASRPPTSASQRRKPSFRRTLSFSTMHRTRASTFNVSSRSLTSSQSSNLPFPILGHAAHPRTSHGRPASAARPAPRHVCHRSSNSIDPSAQYYQDPEARLKLRVYLASPQKFDEAIEFGFPSLDNKENLRPKPSREWKRSPQTSHQDSERTFLDDDTPSVDGDAAGDENGDQKEGSESEIDKDSGFDNLQPLQQLSSWNPPVGRHREMTLKMTLTRPDLRTADTSYNDADDPLKLADLPPADENANLWDDSPEREGVVKKMWRKFRRRRD